MAADRGRFCATRYSPAEQWREYRACQQPKWSNIEVDFKKRKGVWRVSSRYAYWA